MPLAPPPTPTALDFLQASRLASCLPSKAAGVGNVTSSERSQTGPVPSVLVNHTGRGGRGYKCHGSPAPPGARAPSPPQCRDRGTPSFQQDRGAPVRSARASCHTPGSSPLPARTSSRQSTASWNPPGRQALIVYAAELAFLFPSVPARGGGEPDVALGRHDFESGKHTYQQPAEHGAAGNSQGH